MSVLINRRDLDFVLYELLNIENLAQTSRYEGQDRALYEATIDAAETLAEEQFATHAAESDENEPKLEDGKVKLIPAIKQATDAYVEAGVRLWDIAAGGLIVECAGGEFWSRPLAGEHRYGLVASNGLLRRKLMKCTSGGRSFQAVGQ
jgi:3'-phosphoadenosine 5'-phosphosulfate (PAPS) 3'-phosphatase